MHVYIFPTDIMFFVEMINGLYCHDTSKTNYFTHKPKTPVSAYSFMNIVENNISMYTCRGIRNVDKARVLCRENICTSPQRFLNLLDINYFRNCPIKSANAERVTTYGESTQHSCKGRYPGNAQYMYKVCPTPLCLKSYATTILM